MSAAIPIERREIEALLNPAKTMLFGNAVVGNAANVRYAQAYINALQSVLDGTGKRYADFFDSKGGYEAAASFKGAWSPLPEGIKNFTLVQVQEFLTRHGVEVAADTVTNSQVNAVGKLKNNVLTVVNRNDEHDAARADLNDGASVHGASLVDAAIVAQGGAA